MDIIHPIFLKQIIEHENYFRKRNIRPKFYSRYDKLYFKNVNFNIEKIIKIKRLKKLQRQCSRKCELNMKGVCCQKTKNIAKIENKIKKLHSKLKNIRLKHIINQTTSKIVKTKPLIVFMEDLKVSNMMKNKHLSKAIAEQEINLIK